MDTNQKPLATRNILGRFVVTFCYCALLTFVGCLFPFFGDFLALGGAVSAWGSCAPRAATGPPSLHCCTTRPHPTPRLPPSHPQIGFTPLDFVIPLVLWTAFYKPSTPRALIHYAVALFYTGIGIVGAIGAIRFIIIDSVRRGPGGGGRAGGRADAHTWQAAACAKGTGCVRAGGQLLHRATQLFTPSPRSARPLTGKLLGVCEPVIWHTPRSSTHTPGRPAAAAGSPLPPNSITAHPPLPRSRLLRPNGLPLPPPPPPPGMCAVQHASSPPHIHPQLHRCLITWRSIAPP